MIFEMASANSKEFRLGHRWGRFENRSEPRQGRDPTDNSRYELHYSSTKALSPKLCSIFISKKSIGVFA